MKTKSPKSNGSELQSIWGIGWPEYDAKKAYDLVQLFTFDLSGEELARERCRSLSLHLDNGTPLTKNVRTWANTALAEIADGKDANAALGLKRSRGRAESVSSKQNQDRMIAFLVQQLIDRQDDSLGRSTTSKADVFQVVSEWLKSNDMPSYEGMTASGTPKTVRRSMGTESVKKIYLANREAILAAKIG